MEKAYLPKDHEPAILKAWEEQKIFLAKTKNESKTGKNFTVPLPPPNVTGQLHLGHAMMLVVQDIMTRYHRMKGDATLWLPGTDHAAIATESVVLKNLGVASREEFTREEFMEKCFDHTKKTHATITNQVKKMGSSCDFTRERYTMDLGLSNAVWKIFKDLYSHDLIVRGHRMVNWSSGAQSVLADDELEYEDRKDAFAYIRCGRFVMGTVRTETKCADSPLVLHPNENYVVAKFTDSDGKDEEFVFAEVLFDDIERRGKIFNQLDENGTWEKISIHPGKFFEGEEFEAQTYAGKRKFFVLCDDEVIDINKGSGAMTISVNHAADDYLLAKKYPKILKDYYFEKIGFDGKMTSLAGELEGIEVAIARKRAVKMLLEKNLIVGLEKGYVHNVPLCYRTGCVVEPMISPQWFIDVNKEFAWQEGIGAIADLASQSVKTSLKKLTLEAISAHGGETNLIPDRFTKIYDQWIENLQDWCISRQIWWGHQIPIWYDKDGNQHIAQEQKLLFEIEKYSDIELITEKNPLEFAKKNWEKIAHLTAQKSAYIISGTPQELSYLLALKDGATDENFLEISARKEQEILASKKVEIIWMMKPAGVENLRQDNDTLDTWFSSALWPFSTLGWPDKTPDFENFFPTSVLETGHDILFFWVARMIMFSRFATGKNPFKDVYLHGLVCDENGKKMSKSKGNGIDPLEMIEKYGTDALRMALVVGTTPGNQVNLGEKKIEGYRNFSNKLWNVSRYILALEKNECEISSASASLPEQWILSKLQTLIAEVSSGIEDHKYGEVGQKLYDFTWNDLADWAIESAKTAESKTLGNTLHSVLETLLQLLHPYIPFVTETIWAEMGNTKLLAVTDFPTLNTQLQNIDAEEKFLILQNIIGKIRSLRSAAKVDPVKKITAILQGENIDFLKENQEIIKLLARLETLEFGEKPGEECVNDIISGTEIFLPLAGMLDMEKEAKRKEKELEDAKKMLKNLEGRIANTKYMESAPVHLVAQTRAQYEEIKEKIRVLEG